MHSYPSQHQRSRSHHHSGKNDAGHRGGDCPWCWNRSICSISAYIASCSSRTGARQCELCTLLLQGHISKILKHYYDEISIYKDELDRMEDKSSSQQELVKVITQTMSPWRQLLGLMPYLWVESLQIIWRSRTRKWSRCKLHVFDKAIRVVSAPMATSRDDPLHSPTVAINNVPVILLLQHFYRKLPLVNLLRCSYGLYSDCISHEIYPLSFGFCFVLSLC